MYIKDVSLFQNFLSSDFIEDLKKRRVEIRGFIPLDESPALSEFILEELGLELDFDILYPEGFLDEITYKKEDKHLHIMGYTYLVKFYQKDSDGDDYIWYSAYKDLNNLNKELISIDLGESI